MPSRSSVTFGILGWMTVEVWVTVACSKTRAALDGLQQAGQRYQTRSCVDAPPTPEELRDVLRRLDAEPWDIARDQESSDAGFADLPRDESHREDWVAALI